MLRHPGGQVVEPIIELLDIGQQRVKQDISRFLKRLADLRPLLAKFLCRRDGLLIDTGTRRKSIYVL
ncbi:hypothetical protein D3C80_1010450 [compost metagenome]